eukprot:CAMPEP_0204265154 /NCGR_PEP_ID=MMETSP0468-20130131/9489_1 /ASSEMBLY_ACC=CAM_ASM_000383 /TAXON_ID=2969 /ORGANISM="Oxyrrhis marina" /LENGTH=80 /DNA_ID=CAMNT_0051240079 /DNA_START=62 /DNA_END=301 /DNA_ORIENTATION=+
MSSGLPDGNPSTKPKIRTLTLAMARSACRGLVPLTSFLACSFCFIDSSLNSKHRGRWQNLDLATASQVHSFFELFREKWQ